MAHCTQVIPTPIGVQMQAKLDSDEAARIDFRISVPPDPVFPDTLFFDVAPHPDDPLAPVGGVNPCSQPGAANFFDVLFGVELNSFASHLSHFEIAQGQALTFLDPTVEPNQDGFHILFGIECTDGAPQSLLFSITLSGNFVHMPEPGSLTLLVLGLAGVGFSRRRAA